MLSHRRPSDLTPVLFAGILLRPLPALLLRAPARAALRAVMRRYPEIGERLADLEGRTLLLDPTDLPVLVLLRFGANGPTLDILAPAEGAPAFADAVVHGPLLTLVDLLEGQVDGDALFFARRLEVEGDMDVVVALRNALDGAAINLGDALAARFGPLESPALRAVRSARALFRRMNADVELVGAAARAEHSARLDAHDAALDRIERATAARAKPRRAGAP